MATQRSWAFFLGLFYYNFFFFFKDSLLQFFFFLDFSSNLFGIKILRVFLYFFFSSQVFLGTPWTLSGVATDCLKTLAKPKYTTQITQSSI